MKEIFGSITQDFRFALRQMRRRRSFTVTALLILSVGIGSSTAVFSVFFEVLLKPPPYADAKSLLFLHNIFPKSQVANAGVSGFDYAELKRHRELFADAGVFYENHLILTGHGSARHLNVVNASASLFNVLGVQPSFGRTFSTSEDRSGAAGTVVLSDALWHSVFSGNKRLLGQSILLNGLPYVVIGVMPPSFEFPSRETQVWIPTSFRPGELTFVGGRSEKWLQMVARLAPGTDLNRAIAGLQTISIAIGKQFPKYYPQQDGWHFGVRKIVEEQTEAIRHWLYLAFGAVLSVLVVACINVSGLLLIEGNARASEIAVRRASGATGRRIVLQMLTESGAMVLCGCLLGLLFSVWIVHLVNIYGPLARPIPKRVESWAFTLLIAVVSTFLVGLIPSLHNATLSVDQTLRSGATRTATRGGITRYIVVGLQIAFAFVLLFTGIQLGRSFLNLTRVDPGFSRANIWTGAITLPAHRYVANQSWNTSFFVPLLQKIRQIPGVQAASGVNALPFNPSGVWTEEFRMPGMPAMQPRPEAQIGLVFPGYFETIGIPVLKGRTFADNDKAGAQPVAVIDERLMRRYFRDENPVGKFIASGGAVTPAKIIGVVGSVQNRDLSRPREPEVYYSALQERTEATYLVLRVDRNPDASEAVREAVTSLDPDVALYDVAWMEARVAEPIKLRSFITSLLGALAATGLILASIGLYGSLSHLVSLRRREIGIRIALGARNTQVFWIVLARAVVVIASGIALGITGSLVMGQALRTQLFGVDIPDVETWSTVLASMLLASTIASCLPAWRAARIEPSIALRNE